MTEDMVKVSLKSTVPTHYTLNTTPLQPDRLKRLVTRIEPALMISFADPPCGFISRAALCVSGRGREETCKHATKGCSDLF